MAEGFKVDFSQVANNMNNLDDKILAMCLMYAHTKKPEILGWMQSNRPWTDRTGQAKKMLNVAVTSHKTNNDAYVRFTLSHGVNYGIWLEICNSQKYAILLPTINIKGREITNGLQGLLNRI